MLKRFLTLSVLSLLIAGLNSCGKKQDDSNLTQGLPIDIQNKIASLGFSPENASKTDGGYIVEGDIFLTDEDLNAGWSETILRVGESEQYRTTNLVTNLPRNITVHIKTSGSNALPTSYAAALDVALARYNAQSLLLTFTRVTSASGANVKITKAPANAGYLASAGFPTNNGNPYSSIVVNSTYLGSNPNQNYLATILAHEMGHCIGFRHTDYMDRSYSCGGSYYNEGSAGVGAINIPGTPTGPDPNSWMLACIGANQNRPFNANDITALNYLY